MGFCLGSGIRFPCARGLQEKGQKRGYLKQRRARKGHGENTHSVPGQLRPGRILRLEGVGTGCAEGRHVAGRGMANALSASPSASAAPGSSRGAAITAQSLVYRFDLKLIMPLDPLDQIAILELRRGGNEDPSLLYRENPCAEKTFHAS